jgi:hypothetical protein
MYVAQTTFFSRPFLISPKLGYIYVPEEPLQNAAPRYISIPPDVPTVAGGNAGEPYIHPNRAWVRGHDQRSLSDDRSYRNFAATGFLLVGGGLIAGNL